MIFEYTKEFTPEAVYFLKRTIEKDELGAESLPSIIEAVEKDAAIMFYIKEYDELFGVLVLAMSEDKKFLNVVSLGGKRLGKWRKELRDFVVNIAEKTQTRIVIISWTGWKKIFPELRVVGSVYSFGVGCID